MLTVTTMSGAWSVINSMSVGGSAFGLSYNNWSWIVAIPSGGTSDVTLIKGHIVQSELDGMGDRDCLHYDVDGSFISHGNKFTRSVIDPTEASYVGPPIRIESFYFPCEGYRSSFTAAGIITQGLQPWLKTFPDHQYSDVKLMFRNIWIRGEVDGNRTRFVYHYESKAISGSTWSITDTATSWCEFDFVNNRCRIGTSSWKYFRSLSATGTVPKFNVTKFSTNQWGVILNRLRMVHPDPNVKDIMGDLCRRCANDAQLLDLNGIEYLSDIREITTELKGLLSLLKGKASLKSGAKLFLTYKYGLRLTVQDTLSIFQAIPRHLRQTSRRYRWTRASESTTSASYAPNAWSRKDLFHYKVYYEPYDSGLVNAVDQMWSVGLFPSLENSWDLIPMSFVVDWFTKTSSYLSAYDASTYWSCNRVLGGLMSRKAIFDGVQSDVLWSSLSNCAGVATVTEYARFGADTIVTPTFFTDAPRTFKNYAEATALLIARSKTHK